MSNVKCPFCGEPCRVWGGEKMKFLVCRNDQCPGNGTRPEDIPDPSPPPSAPALAPQWTTEPPKVVGEYRARYASTRKWPRWITVTQRQLDEAPPEFWAGAEYAGPYPEPNEPQDREDQSHG